MKRFVVIISIISLILSMWSCTNKEDKEPPCAHAYGEWNITVKSPDGLIYNEERVCKYCGNTEERTVNLLDSVPPEWIETFDALINIKDNPVADIYYMSYATAEDRYTRNGTAVEHADKLIYNDRSCWNPYDSIPQNIVDIFVTYATPESPVALDLVKAYIGEGDVDPRQITALEEKYGKSALIEIYLNTLRFSDEIYGINAAAKDYLDKYLSELDIADTIMLCAIVNAGDPRTSPEENKIEYESILAALQEKGKISQEEYTTALTKEFTFNQIYTPVLSWYNKVVYDDAIDLLSQKYETDAATAEKMLYSDNLKIYTVMDPDIQSILEAFYAEPSNFISISGGTQPQSAMVITDPATGDLLAVVGSRGENISNDMPDYATEITRSPGSSIKPVAVYGPCLEKGLIHYSTLVDDNYYSMLNDRPWPSNYPEGYRGLTPVYDGIRRSVNTIAVRLLMQYGATESYEFVHDKLGMHSVVYSETTSSGYTVNDRNASALALGGMLHGLTVRELAGAYQIFNNGGVFTGNRTILKIEDRYGNVIVDNEGTPSQVISAPNASIMTKMLEGVVDSGTASTMVLDDRIDCAGKTGTTSYDKDRWFMGYTPYYIGGVWFGYANSRSLEGFSEVRSPAIDVWDKVMTLIHEKKVFSSGLPQKSFEVTEGVVIKNICSATGRLAKAGCGNRITEGYYTEDNMPTEYCHYHP